MGSRKEKDIKDALEFIRFEGNQTDFYKAYKSTLDFLGINFSSLSYWNIILTYCHDNIKNSNKVRIKETNNIRFGEFGLRKSLRKFVNAFNSRYKYSQLGIPKVIRIKKENALFVHIAIMRPSNSQQTRKTTYNPKNTGSYFCLYILRDKNEIYYFRGDKLVLGWINWWFKSKLKIKFKEIELKEFPSTKLKKFLENPEIKIFEMSFRNPHASISDKIIIKSKKGECLSYMDKIKGVLFDKETENKDVSIYDLEYVRFSYKGNKIIKLKFNRKIGYYIELDTIYNYKEQVPNEIKDYLEDNLLLFDKIDEMELLKIAIHRGYLDLFDYQNPHIRPFIDQLVKEKIISIEPFYKYWCTNPLCKYSTDKRKPSERKTCLCGAVSKNEFIAHYNLSLNYKKIISLLGAGLKKKGFTSYKTMSEGYLKLNYSSIIRIKDNENYFYILLNKRGLKVEEIANLKLYGIPMLIINLKGEINSTLEGFNKINSGELVSSLIKKDYEPLGKLLRDFKENIPKLRINSFNIAMNELKKKDIDPLLFERAIFSVFNFIFPECQKWGGPRLADGSFPFKYGKIKYLLWDAKRYNSTLLSDYVEKKGLKKDIPYMENFNNNKIIRNFGSVKYYLFVTSNTSKTDFISLRDTLKKQINSSKTHKKLKSVKILCFDKKELLNFAEYVEKNHDKIILNYLKFVKTIKKGIDSSDGYLEFDALKSEAETLLNDKQIYPTASELRMPTK